MKSWNLELARALLLQIETALGGVHHVGLLGSVLHAGYSKKDLDIVIYPHTTFGTSPVTSRRHVRTVLDDIGLTQILSHHAVKHAWEEKGSQDGKFVEIWADTEGRRIDVFYMQ